MKTPQKMTEEQRHYEGEIYGLREQVRSLEFKLRIVSRDRDAWRDAAKAKSREAADWRECARLLMEVEEE
jgi:hypothetical protein